jgi:hypothetical protein
MDRLFSDYFDLQLSILVSPIMVFFFKYDLLSMLYYLQKYYMLYLTICTYNITFLIVVMVIITVCYLLGTLLEGVEVYRFNKCTKFLLIFSDEVRFACWPCSYFLRKILSVGFGVLAMKQDLVHGLVFITTSALCVLTQMINNGIILHLHIPFSVV